MPNEIDITVVVNGQPIQVSGNRNAPLHTIIPKALHDSGNVGQPPENWELRDLAGALLDTNQKIEAFDFNAETKLFLNLKAGVGG